MADTVPSYVDFIIEDRAYLASKRYAKDLGFWQDRYTNPPQPLLATAKPTTALSHSQTSSLIWPLDKALFQRIEVLAATQGLSVLHFMYALLACYFSRTADTQEIVIGIPVHNRKNARQKHTLGMFSSVIPIKVLITAQDTFSDVMNKAAAELRLCYKHQRAPMAEINRLTQARQKTGRARLFDITLSLELFDAECDMSTCTVTAQKPKRGTALPLAIHVQQYTNTHLKEVDQPIEIEFNFDTHYLSKAEVVALKSRLGVLMEGALSCPHSYHINLPLLPTSGTTTSIGGL